jgi:hypothetical protein
MMAVGCFAGLVFLGSQSGNSQLLELSFRYVSPGSDPQALHQCTVRNEALVDSLAPTQDALVYEDPPGARLRADRCQSLRHDQCQRPVRGTDEACYGSEHRC